jgi:hypothetical protein
MDELMRYIDDGDRFALWVGTMPDLCLQVAYDLKVSTGFIERNDIDALSLARDAVTRLHALALDGGFEDAATLFYDRYQSFCHLISDWYFSEVG